MDQANQQRYAHDRLRLDWGGIAFGLILVSIGAYVLIENVLGIDLPDVSWNTIWPALLIVGGASILIRAARGEHDGA